MGFLHLTEILTFVEYNIPAYFFLSNPIFFHLLSYILNACPDCISPLLRIASTLLAVVQNRSKDDSVKDKKATDRGNGDESAITCANCVKNEQLEKERARIFAKQKEDFHKKLYDNCITVCTTVSKQTETKHILDLVNDVFSSKVFMVAMTAPWVRFVFPSLTGYNKRLDALQAMRNHIKIEVDKHELDLDDENPRDLIDSYLTEIKNNPDPEFCKEQLVMIGIDLMGAGSETSSTTLMWALLFLVRYPEIQEKCFKEIEMYIGESKVTLEDSEKLNFCQATVAEIQRVGEVALSSLQHRVTEEVTLPSGHVIPKDSLVMSNIKKFLSDPLLWNKPSEFSPDRFLDSSGKFYRPEYFVPLGHGRRQCLGEPLARAELFIFFVTLVQRIKFEAIDDQMPDPSNYSVGITKYPNQFKVKTQMRFS